MVFTIANIGLNGDGFTTCIFNELCGFVGSSGVAVVIDGDIVALGALRDGDPTTNATAATGDDGGSCVFSTCHFRHAIPHLRYVSAVGRRIV